MPNNFSGHKKWYSTIIHSPKSRTNTSSLDGHGYSPDLLNLYDNVAYRFSALFSKKELEYSKKSPGFISSNENKSVVLTPPAPLSSSPSIHPPVCGLLQIMVTMFLWVSSAPVSGLRVIALNVIN